MALLNIAQICPSTRALEPGQRLVIWVQGCCFDCLGQILAKNEPIFPILMLEFLKPSNIGNTHPSQRFR